MEMPERWTLGDVLDYEVLLEGEGGRDWFQSYGGKLKPGYVLHSWVRAQRGSNTSTLPGPTVERLYRIATAVMAIVGLAAGTGLGWGVLAYAGSDPVNLFLALILLVGIPLILTLVSLILNLLPLGSDRSRRLVDRMMKFIRGVVAFSRRLGMVDRAHADAVNSGFSRFRGRSALYGGLVRWSVSLPVQLRTFSFHIGILVAVMWRGIVQDLAFAWQTTLRVTPESIHGLAFRISWPWRVLIHPPTVDQVAGSRIVLKDGIAGLNNADLIAWWPYICCAILAYGVLPRLLLLAYGILRRRLTLLNLPFTDIRSRRLLMVMKAPRVDFVGIEPPREHGNDVSTVPLPTSIHKSMAIRILIPSTREDLMLEESWKEYLNEQWGAVLSDVIAVSLDDEEDAGIIESLSGNLSDTDGILLIFEGWRPYTAAAGLYVESIQSLLPPGITILIALAGRPGSGFFMEEGDRETLDQWKRLLPVEIVELLEWR